VPVEFVWAERNGARGNSRKRTQGDAEIMGANGKRVIRRWTQMDADFKQKGTKATKGFGLGSCRGGREHGEFQSAFKPATPNSRLLPDDRAPDLR